MTKKWAMSAKEVLHFSQEKDFVSLQRICPLYINKAVILSAKKVND